MGVNECAINTTVASVIEVGGFAIATAMAPPIDNLPLAGDPTSLGVALLHLLLPMRGLYIACHCLPIRGLNNCSMLDGSTPNHAVRGRLGTASVSALITPGVTVVVVVVVVVVGCGWYTAGGKSI